MVWKLGEVSETFLPAADAVSWKTCRGKPNKITLSSFKTKKNKRIYSRVRPQSSLIAVWAWNDADSYLVSVTLISDDGNRLTQKCIFPILVRQEAPVHEAHQDVLRDAGGLGTDQLKACRDFDGLCCHGDQAEVFAGLTETWGHRGNNVVGHLFFFFLKSLLTKTLSGISGFTVQRAGALRRGGLQVGKRRAAAVGVVVFLQLLRVVGGVAVHQLGFEWLPDIQAVFGRHIWRGNISNEKCIDDKCCSFLYLQA